MFYVCPKLFIGAIISCPFQASKDDIGRSKSFKIYQFFFCKKKKNSAELLKSFNTGDFIVRFSGSESSFTVTVKTSMSKNQSTHTRIIHDKNGFSLDSKTSYPTVVDLINAQIKSGQYHRFCKTSKFVNDFWTYNPYLSTEDTTQAISHYLVPKPESYKELKKKKKDLVEEILNYESSDKIPDEKRIELANVVLDLAIEKANFK